MNNTSIWIKQINGIARRHVGLCTKVVQPTALFSNSKHLFVRCFCQSADRLTWHSSASME